MSSEVEEISVQLQGKTFCFRADTGKKADLLNAVTYLNEQMRVMKGNSTVLGFERVITLTAINIVNEMLSGSDNSKQELLEVTERLNKLNAKINKAIDRLSGKSPNNERVILSFDEDPS